MAPLPLRMQYAPTLAAKEQVLSTSTRPPCWQNVERRSLPFAQQWRKVTVAFDAWTPFSLLSRKWHPLALASARPCAERPDALFRRKRPVWKSKFYGAFVLNRRVVLHAIDATPAR